MLLAAEKPSSIFARAHRATTLGLLTVISMIAFEAMAVGPALPSAAGDLHAIASYGWVFTTVLAASVIGMVVAGQVSEVRGPRLPLAGGIVAFALGLLVAGTATTMVQLVLARGIQGLGVGLAITASYVVIGECYPPELRPRVFTATSSAWVLPSLLGPVLSGLITEHAGWRWVFLGLLPFVVLGSLLLVPTLRVLDRPAGEVPRDPKRVLRAVAVAGGLTLVEGAGQHASALGVVGLIAGLAVVGWGIVPLLPAGTFRARPGVAAPVAMRGLMAGAFFGVEATVPLMLTVQHGYGAFGSGVPLTLAGVTWAVGSWWQGRAGAADDAHRLRLAMLGYVLIAAAALLVAVASQHGLSPWPVYLAWTLGGGGAGLTMPSASVLLLRHTTDADRGADSAALQLADTTSAALTTSFAGILVALAAAGSLGYGAAFAINDAVMFGVALLGVVAAHRASATRP